MPARGQSAINGAAVNISHLEREIRRDVSCYRQYKAEDGMKKRAIHSSKDYDEFRNLVSVSQLKPSSGHDVSSLFSGTAELSARGSNRNNMKGGRVGGFDEVIKKRENASISSIATQGSIPSQGGHRTVGRHTTKSSRTAYDFFRHWKQHCKTAEETLSFLTRTENADGSSENQLVLPPETTCKEYFSTDVESEILGGIVEALHLLIGTERNSDQTSAENDPLASENRVPDLLASRSSVDSFTHCWFKSLATCGRFELSVSFLLPDQQQKLKEICHHLKIANFGNEGNDNQLDKIIQCLR
ncbi:hypothetical protein ACHAWF_008524 [Thalassiosira exigua]